MQTPSHARPQEDPAARSHGGGAPAGPTGRCYLYGVGGPGLAESGPAGLVGINDAPVVLMPVAGDGVWGGACAAVSAAPTGRLRPERRHLSAHQRVVSALAAAEGALVERGDVGGGFLPVAFGMVPDSPGAVSALLREHAAEIAEQLSRVAGAAEMTVRVGLAGGDAFRHFVEADATLRSLRDSMLAGGGGGAGGAAAHEAKMAVGRAFELALASARAEVEEAARVHLGGASREIIIGTPRSESQMATVSCLVDRGAAASLAFDAAVEAMAAELDDALAVEVSGPWPCHSFVDLRLVPAESGPEPKVGLPARGGR